MPVVGPYKVYTRRWFVLILVTALSLSNTEIWCSYASVANIAAKYYKISMDEISLLSMVFFLCCFPLGIFALWFTDYVGLNRGVWVGAWLNAIGAAIRFISTTRFVAESLKFKITLLGQITAGLAQMYLYIPTKIAEVWFPSNERTLATSLMAMANPLGIMLGTGIMPLVVTKPSDIPLMNFISCLFAIMCVICTCGFTSSKPPVPPSESARIEVHSSFPEALKEMVTNKAYLMVSMFGGAIIGVAGIFVSLLESILHPNGYSNKFSGLCILLMLSFGIVGSALCGLLVDKTKAFTPIAKITGGLTCVVFPIYSVVLELSNTEYLIGVLSAIFGIFLLMAYTVLLELAVECTFPVVPEATSTGVLFIMGQLHGTIYFLIIELFASETKVEDIQTLDMNRSLLLVVAILVFFCLVFIICFKTEYKRTKEEHISNFEGIHIVNSVPQEAKITESITYGTIS